MTEQELNKACEWLKEHWGDYYAPVEYRKLTDDFRKAMCAVIKDSLSTAETAVKESLTTVYDADYLQSKIDLHTKYMQEHGITSEQQLAELDEMRGMSEFTTNPWIKASDELPKEGEHILFAKSLCEGGTPYYETVYYPEPGITDGIDYWMPIPKLPKED